MRHFGIMLAFIMLSALIYPQQGNGTAPGSAPGALAQVHSAEEQREILLVRYAFEKCKLGQAKFMITEVEACFDQNGIQKDFSQYSRMIDDFDAELYAAADSGNVQKFNSLADQSRQNTQRAVEAFRLQSQLMFSPEAADAGGEEFAKTRRAIVACVNRSKDAALSNLKTCREAAIEGERDLVVGKFRDELAKQQEIIALYESKGFGTSKLEELNSGCGGFVDAMDRSFEDKKPRQMYVNRLLFSRWNANFYLERLRLLIGRAQEKTGDTSTLPALAARVGDAFAACPLDKAIAEPGDRDSAPASLDMGAEIDAYTETNMQCWQTAKGIGAGYRQFAAGRTAS
jgi:hypothetical protein